MEVSDAIGNPIAWLVIVSFLAFGVYRYIERRKRMSRSQKWEGYLSSGPNGSPIGLLRYENHPRHTEEFRMTHARALSGIHGVAWSLVVASWKGGATSDYISEVVCYADPIPLNSNGVRKAMDREDATVISCVLPGSKSKSGYADGVMIVTSSGARVMLRTFDDPLDCGAWSHELIHIGQYYIAAAGTSHDAWLDRHWELAERFRRWS